MHVTVESAAFGARDKCAAYGARDKRTRDRRGKGMGCRCACVWDGSSACMGYVYIEMVSSLWTKRHAQSYIQSAPHLLLALSRKIS